MSRTSTLISLAALSLAAILASESSASANSLRPPLLLMARQPAAALHLTQLGSLQAQPRLQPRFANQSRSLPMSNSGSRPAMSHKLNMSAIAPLNPAAVRFNPYGHGALRNPAAVGGIVPNIVGQGGSTHGPGQKIPGFSSSFGGANSLNQSNSGGRTGGIKKVPGFDTSNVGANGLNLPGSRDNRPGADAADKFMNQQEQQAAGILGAANNGVDVNTPQQASAGAMASDGLIDSVVNYFTGGGSSAPEKGSSASGPAGSGEKSAASATGAQAPLVNTGTVVYELETDNVESYSENPSSGSTIVSGTRWRDSNGYSGVSGVTIGPITISRGKQMPGDDSTGHVDASAGLAVHNAYDNRNNGGGTGNNDEQSTGGLGQIDPASQVQHLNDGDGAGTDAGDNGIAHKLDGLAASSSLATKDQGDGGSADSRGGASTLSGGALIRKPVGAGQRLVQSTGQ